MALRSFTNPLPSLFIFGPALGISHHYWAMVAAVLLLQPPLWALVLIIAVLQFSAEMLIARQYMLAQAVVTPLALLATVLATSAHTGALPSGAESSALMYDRAVETVIGSIIGVICVLFPWVWRRYVKRTPDPTRSVGPETSEESSG